MSNDKMIVVLNDGFIITKTNTAPIVFKDVSRHNTYCICETPLPDRMT